jgi:Pentapeptide repeats (8 copies)
MTDNHGPQTEPAEVIRRRRELQADCSRCAALCCVVPAFKRSADFAISKPARQPCPHLTAGFRCSIHDRLRPSGFSGCAAFDCFGAGQAVVQGMFGGQDWRTEPDLAEPMFAAFPVMRQLHELEFYLNEALALRPADPLPARLGDLLAETARLAGSRPEDLASVDMGEHHGRANAVLLATSEQVRTRAGLLGPDLRGADLAGKDLRRTELAGASLRGALLIAANLTGANLSYTDVTGADLRGAGLSGADLTTTLFLSQQQLDSARGDAATTLPDRLTRPEHWPARRLEL